MYIFFVNIIAFPYHAFAQFDSSNAKTLLRSMTGFISSRIVPTLIALALVYVVYAGVQYIGANEESQGREEKKQKLFWGVIGLFVILSVWALVLLVSNTFGISLGWEFTDI